MQYPELYDVTVIGGGHAGTEAALASARSGASTLLITHNIETIGQMSCNPAIGGIGKGHLVKEIDALGGVMARAADAAAIQLRTLNSSKGPAVRATRAQCDRNLYRAFIRKTVEQQPNLAIFQSGVEDLLTDGGRVIGCLTAGGLEFRSTTVVLTTGTFLGGKIHVGEQQSAGGRAGDDLGVGLSGGQCLGDGTAKQIEPRERYTAGRDATRQIGLGPRGVGLGEHDQPRLFRQLRELVLLPGVERPSRVDAQQLHVTLPLLLAAHLLGRRRSFVGLVVRMIHAGRVDKPARDAAAQFDAGR